MNALPLAAALAALPTANFSLIQSSGVRRVHVLVDAETKEIELVRVHSVRAGYYRGYVAMAVEADRLCRGYCDLDVDVDPRLDYVLRVGDEEPRALDLTAHGDSVIVKVTPPSGGLRAGGVVMLVGGIVTTSIGGLTTLLSVAAGALSQNSFGSRNTLFGLDATFVMALGVGAVAVGVANIIVGVILKRRATMEVDTMRGDVPPGAGPPPLPDGVPPPPPPPPPPGTAVM